MNPQSVVIVIVPKYKPPLPRPRPVPSTLRLQPPTPQRSVNDGSGFEIPIVICLIVAALLIGILIGASNPPEASGNGAGPILPSGTPGPEVTE